MLRFVCLIVLSQVALAATAGATDLSGYVGKSVQDTVGGRRLFDQPDVKRNFVKAFGSARYQRILNHMQGDGIKTVTDSELNQLIVTEQCEHHNCPNQSVIIMQMNATMIGLCLSDLAPGNPNAGVVEWSGLNWSITRTGDGLSCRGESPESDVAAFKAARARTQ